MSEENRGERVYGAAYRSSSEGFEASAWESADTQRARFEVFRQLAPLDGEKVLDLGCARGDFAVYLIEKQVAFASFVGVDVILESILLASQRGLARCEFYQGDALDEDVVALHAPGVVCISGTLNTMDFAASLRVLEAAWKGTRRALVFNFLPKHDGAEAPREGSALRRHDTHALLAWALKKSPRVAFRQGYLQRNDATIFVEK